MSDAMTTLSSKVLTVPEDFQFRHADLYPKMNAPVGEIRGELERLHALDKAAEAKKAKLKTWLWVTGLLTFLGFVVVVTLPAAIPFGILIYMYFQTEKADLEDRRLDVARHLLDVLEDEIDPTAPVVMELDFRLYAKTGGHMVDGKTVYEHPWMRLGLVLRNGSALQITATTVCKRKSKRKRKYTRHTDKLNEMVALEIHPPKRRVFDPNAQNKVAHAVRQPLPNARLRRCRIRPKVAELQFLTDLTVRTQPPRYGGQPWEGRAHLLDATKVLAMTTMGYRAANGATREVARAG